LASLRSAKFQKATASAKGDAVSTEEAGESAKVGNAVKAAVKRVKAPTRNEEKRFGITGPSVVIVDVAVKETKKNAASQGKIDAASLKRYFA
jgi:hypothetical protein